MAHFLPGDYAEALSWAEKALHGTARSSAVHAFRRRGQRACRAAGRGREELVARMRQLDPDFDDLQSRRCLALRRPEDLARLADGLRKAGLPE